MFYKAEEKKPQETTKGHVAPFSEKKKKLVFFGMIEQMCSISAYKVHYSKTATDN